MNYVLVIIWGFILGIVFYIASKLGFKKEVVAIMLLSEVIPIISMYMIAFSYYNAAIKGQLSIYDLSTFIQWFVSTLIENTLESILANIGGILFLLILRLLEEYGFL